MTDHTGMENAAAKREATDTAGRPHARGSRAGDIEAGLMRYLAAEAYHEKVEESRAEKKAGDPGSRPE